MIERLSRRLFGAWRRHPWISLTICLALGAMVSVLRGQDVNWDLLNYHLYNPWAWLTGHDASDLAVAGPQSYYNPLPDLPFYWMVSGPLGAWPRLVSAIQGLWYGGLIFVVGVLVDGHARRAGREPGMGELLAWLIGVSGSAVVAQAGATFNEVPMGLLVLVALVLLLDAVPMTGRADPRQVRRAWNKVLMAGLLAGMAVGLKPTAIIDAPALALLALVLAPRASWWRLLVGFGLAGVAGVVVTDGAWALHLYRLTGNPFFPMFNNVFHSDWISAVSGTDARFRPQGVLQWLFYPFEWTVHMSRRVSEPSMRDPRLAVVWASVLVLGGAMPWRVRRARAAGGVGPDLRAEAALLVFLGVAYAGWLALFSIYRYVIPVEALSGLAGLLLMRYLFAWVGQRRILRGVLVGACVLMVLMLLVTVRRPDWGHRAFASRAVEVQAPALPDHALVLVVGQPHAFVVPFLKGRDLSFIGLTWFTAMAHDHRLARLVRRRIDRHKGPVWAVIGPVGIDDGTAGADAMLGRYGLVLEPVACHPVTSNLVNRVRMCPLHRR